jgi:hypothetical protein
MKYSFLFFAFAFLFFACQQQASTAVTNDKEEKDSSSIHTQIQPKEEPVIEESSVEEEPVPEADKSILLKFKEVQTPYHITRIRDWDDYHSSVQEAKGFYKEKLTDNEITQLFGKDKIPDGPSYMVGLYTAFYYKISNDRILLIGKDLGDNFIVQMVDSNAKRIGAAKEILYTAYASKEDSNDKLYSDIYLYPDKIIVHPVKVMLGNEVDPKTKNLEIIGVDSLTPKYQLLILPDGIGEQTVLE